MTTDRGDVCRGEALVAHVQAFCRTLRKAGLPIGPSQVVDALRALSIIGLGRRDDVRQALCAVLVKDPAHFRIFRQAFHAYFGAPGMLERLRRLPVSPDDGRERERERLERSLLAAIGQPPRDGGEAEAQADASHTTSDREVLARKDFEQMSPAELAEARELVTRGVALLRDVPTRRAAAAVSGGRYDPRRSLRLMLRNNGQLLELARKRPRRRSPPLVLICDISGSMSRYSKMFLHFAHALRRRQQAVQCFVFATRLTNVSRRLEQRNVDEALERIASDVVDWDGGTRIGACIRRFNVDWGRRVLAQNAVVILLSDGLECDPDSDLEFQLERLRLSCRRLVWLNPMLRYAGFEPRASGIRRMLPHVDLFLPAHNVESLRALLGIIAESPAARGAAARSRAA